MNKKNIFFLLIIIFSTIIFFNSSNKKDDIREQTNFDISSSTINYFDPSKIDTKEFKVIEDDTPFKVVEYGPVDEMPAHVTHPNIYVLFSQPVVPISKLGTPVTSSNIMKIEPAIDGVYRWYGTKLYAFEPKEFFLDQREYKVTIDDKLRSLGGKSLTGKKSFTFKTEPLKVNNIYPTGEDVPFDQAKNIIVIFNHSVNLNVIKKYIKIYSNNREYSFNVSRPDIKRKIEKEELEKIISVEVQGEFKSNTQVRFVLLKGARSEEDFIGTDTEYIHTFETLKPLIYQSYSFDEYYFPQSDQPTTNPVFINFSHPIDENSFKNNVDFSLDTSKSGYLVEAWGSTVKISNLPVTYNSKYKIFLKKNIKDIYGRELGRDITLEVEVPPAARTYNFPNQGVKMLEAQFPPKIVFEYQNVFDGDWKIDKINDPFKTFSKNELVPYDFSKLKSNVRHFEVLDLKPYLNAQGKGFVGISWNFSRKTIPYQIEYNEFQSFINKIKDTKIRAQIESSFYTNNQRRYYWVNRDIRWDYKKYTELEQLLEKQGFKLERNSYEKTDLQLQVTDFGITTRFGYNKILVWVNSLSTCKPVDRAQVVLKDEGGAKKLEARTNSSGLAVINLKQGDYRNYFYNKINNYQYPRIYVEKRDDKAEFIPNNSHNAYHFGIYNSSDPIYSEESQSHTFIFTDRGVYRPGETVTFRGIDRILKLGEYEVYEGGYEINILKSYWDEKPIQTINGRTTDSGGFYGTVELSDKLDPGWYVLQYKRGKHIQTIGFQVANFRRLNFQVKVNKPDIDTYFVGDNLTFTVNASYLSGGSLDGAKCEYYWTKSIVNFIPNGEQWNGYRFGSTQYDSTNTINEGSGYLNQLGQLVLKQSTDLDNQKGVTYNYVLYAKVEDIDRQVIQGVQSAIVHPASFYIGAKFTSTSSYFVKKGERVDVETVFVKPDGDIYNLKNQKKVTGKLYRVEWKIAQQQGVYNRVNTRYERVEELETEFDFTAKGHTNRFSFVTQKSGQYKLVLECNDEKKRTALTEFYFYSTGSDWIVWGSEGANDLTLFSDKPKYKPGDTAKILVQSPLPEGSYLVTIEREGIFEEKIIELKGSANFIEIPIKENYLPIFYVAVSSYSVRTEKPTNTYTKPDLGKPKGYFGILPVQVSTESKEIEIEIINSKSSYLPGEEAKTIIRATKNGKPLADTEITFLAADRGVLDLINYHIPDPIAFFYDPNKFYLCVEGADSRSLLIDPVTYEVKDLQGGSGDEEEGKVKTRKDFRPTAIFKPFLKTDKKGEVVVNYKLPDTLTTYRATAIAVKSNLFGIKEDEILVQNPINVKTALPRKLRVRDTSFAGVVATNLTGKDQEISVTINSDILTIDGEKIKKVKIPAESSMEIPFKIAAVKEGEANITFTVISDVIRERLEVKLPVETPIIKETFTTIGKIDPKASGKKFAQEGLIIPKYIVDNFGDLEITLDDTKLTTLGGSIQYLYKYPYLCLEQRSSKIFPLVVFKDNVKAYINVVNVKGVVENELNYWAKFQNSDGGFPFWLEGGYSSGYFISVKVAKLLYFASKNGFSIPSSINVNKLLSFIQTQKKSYEYEDLYSLYVLSLWGKNVYIKADEFYKKRDKLNASELAFLTLTFVNLNKKDQAKECFKRLKNFIKVGTQSIDLDDKTNTYYFNSDVNKLALLLMAYNKMDANSEMVTRIVNTLTQRQKNGYWLNTYSTEWVIQAFYEVFEKDNLDESDFKAYVDIQGLNVLTGEFKRKKGLLQSIINIFVDEKRNSYSTNLPLTGDVLGKFNRDTMYPINLRMEGKGVLYYTLSYTYALPFEIVMPRDEGFSVYTKIEDLDGNILENQSELKLGETYRMRAIVSSSRNRNYAILRIPVPSGAEILDASFVTTATYQNKDNKSTSSDDDEYGYWWDYWYKPIQKIYDNEVHYIFDYFKKGKEEVEFLFRVTNPGIYPTPPATMECMYEEEVFGRTSGTLYYLKP